ncbi:hypothetical protein EV562_113230 [Streptomyces sp. BK208]|nr:hypothetical protein EV562_113230 [Streptomyces sp. BK208]
MSAAAVRTLRPRASGLPASASGSARAEIGAGDAVPAQRQTDGLRADAAGTVEHLDAISTDKGVEGVPLPTNAGVPV